MMSPEGIIIRSSPLNVKETVDRLVIFLQDHGVTLYARINQQEELHRVGIVITPLEFILFGNPRTGGKILSVNLVAALDLPLKIISWEDADHRVWVAYNDARYLGKRYSLANKVVDSLNLDILIEDALKPA